MLEEQLEPKWREEYVLHHPLQPCQGRGFYCMMEHLLQKEPLLHEGRLDGNCSPLATHVVLGVANGFESAHIAIKINV